jgi:hypothetical protein
MFSGDLNQLGPVLKDFIPTTMMLFAKRHKKTSSPGKKKKNSNAKQSTYKNRKLNPSALTYSEATQAAIQSKRQRTEQDKEDKRVNNFRPSDLSYKGADLFSKFVRFQFMAHS